MTNPNEYVMPGVRQFQYDRMREYVRDCADVCGLRDFTVHYALQPIGPGRNAIDGYEAAASIDVHPTYRDFTIWLPPSWYERAMGDIGDREEARQTICHELLHVHFKRTDRMMETLQTNVGDHVWGVWHCLYIDENELLVELISQFAAAALPLPDIPKNTPRPSRPKGAAFRADSI